MIELNVKWSLMSSVKSSPMIRPPWMMLPAFFALLVLTTIIPAAYAQDCELLYANGDAVNLNRLSPSIDPKDEGDGGDLYDNLRPGDTYHIFKATRIPEIVINDKDNDNYLEFDLQDDYLHLKVGSNFPNYEETINHLMREFDISIKCDAQTITGVLYINLFDTNNHPPKPDKEEYVYTLPMPLPSGIALTTCLGPSITGREVDITTTSLTAEIEDDTENYFKIDSVEKNNDKTFSVSIALAQQIKFEEERMFHLVITDHGTPNDRTLLKTERIPIRIIPDLEESTYTPQFQKPLHVTEVDDRENTSGMLLNANVEAGYDDELTYHLSSGTSDVDAAQLFTASGNNGVVTVEWNPDNSQEDLDELFNRHFAILVLEARNEKNTENVQSGFTVIHITLPGPKEGTTTTLEPCPTTLIPTECPVCTEVPTTTECPNESTTALDCSLCPTDPTDPGSTTTLDPCPTTITSTECPVCTEVPTTTECPNESTTVLDCSFCSTETTTDPGNSTPCECLSTTPSDCPETPSECTPCQTTTLNPSECDCCSECPKTDPTDDPNIPGSTSTTPDFDVSTMCPDTTTNMDTCDCSSVVPTDCTPATTDWVGSTDPSVTNNPDPSSTPRECDCETDCPNSSTGNPPMCTDPPVTDNPDISTSPSDCDCPSTEPSNCPSESPTCPTDPSATEKPEPSLEFKESVYNERLVPDSNVGVIVVEPKLNKDVKGVVFTLEEVVSIPSGAMEMDPETGVVTLLQSLDLGNHQYMLVATTADDSATARLNVEVPWPCVNVDDVVIFEQAVTIWHVNEESPATLTPEVSKDHDCTIKANGDDSEYFTVDSKTGVVEMIAVNREATEFNKEDYPTLSLWLKATCDGDEYKSVEGQEVHALTVRDAENGENVASVLNSPRQSLIRVVIQDINDNDPVFNPTEITLGYPDRELAELVRPTSLFTAKATDADLGLNAELRYSLDADGAQAFAVHQETGVVYPLSDAVLSAEKLDFTVTATDLAGADEGNTGTLKVTVVPLVKSNLLEAKVTGMLENVPELLETLSSTSGLDLRVLTASVMPEFANATRMGRDIHTSPVPVADETPATTLRLLLYCLQDGSPVRAEDFQDDLNAALDDLGSGGSADEPSLGGEDCDCDGSGGDGGSDGGGGSGGGDGNTDDCSCTGLLAATIVLSVLLGCLFIGSGVGLAIWQYRKRRLRTESKRTLISVESSPDLNVAPLTKDSLKKHDSILSTESDDSHSLGSIGGPSTTWELKKTAMEAEAEEKEPEAVVVPSSTLLLQSIELPRATVTLGASSHDTETQEFDDEEAPASGTSDTASNDDDDFQTKAARKKSGVTFNEDVDCIEIERF